MNTVNFCDTSAIIKLYHLEGLQTINPETESDTHSDE